jgi:exodeoxyribonuclease VII small subunit
MADEKYTFETARVRLEEIASEVRKKDTSLEKSLDLLEEGVRLANICTELVDHTDMSVAAAAGSEEESAALPDDASRTDGAGASDDVHANAEDGAPDRPLEGEDSGEGCGAAGDVPTQDASVE